MAPRPTSRPGRGAILSVLPGRIDAMKISKDYRPLLAQVDGLGLDIADTGSHIHLLRGGRLVGVWPRTPSDRRGPANARADLRRLARAAATTGS